MKDLRDAKKILGMEITWDKINGTLIVSHEKYHLKILGNFGMDKENPVSTPLGIHVKSRATTEREIKEHDEKMEVIPYQIVVSSLMYSMILTSRDLAFSGFSMQAYE